MNDISDNSMLNSHIRPAINKKPTYSFKGKGMHCNKILPEEIVKGIINKKIKETDAKIG
jgi:hypothetical protein